MHRCDCNGCRNGCVTGIDGCKCSYVPGTACRQADGSIIICPVENSICQRAAEIYCSSAGAITQCLVWRLHHIGRWINGYLVNGRPAATTRNGHIQCYIIGARYCIGMRYGIPRACSAVPKIPKGCGGWDIPVVKRKCLRRTAGWSRYIELGIKITGYFNQDGILATKVVERDHFKPDDGINSRAGIHDQLLAGTQ